MEKRDRRWLPVLLSAAVSAVAIGLMLGGWLFSLRSICALPVEDGALLLWTVLLSLAAAACSARFLLVPLPIPTTCPLSRTSTRNVLSWSGPDSSSSV